MLILPPLHGLVLAGGLSSRLGRDKSMLQWHGMPQSLYLLSLLHALKLPAFISLRPEQVVEIPEWATPVKDKFGQIGPAGALLSAMDTYPDCAWLVIACDLPLINEALLSFLISNRNPDAMFTGFANAYGIEPLAGIWEPAAKGVLATNITKGEFSLRKMVHLQHCHQLETPAFANLSNVNTQEELEEICRVLGISPNNSAL